MWICSKCKDTSIQRLAWVDPNDKCFVEWWEGENDSFCRGCYSTCGIEEVDSVPEDTEEDPEDLVCENCGSDEVEVKVWANANTNEIMSDADGTDDGEGWCPVCDKTVYITHRDVYNKKQEGEEEEDETD